MLSNCQLWARVMRQAFPELTLVGGWVDCDGTQFWTSIGSYHEYLITEGGATIDPTEQQFHFMYGEGHWCYNRREEPLLY